MGWVITAWRTDQLAALLDADTRAAADDILQRAERDARHLRRSARRETTDTAALLQDLERLGLDARERVRTQRRERDATWRSRRGRREPEAVEPREPLVQAREAPAPAGDPPAAPGTAEPREAPAPAGEPPAAPGAGEAHEALAPAGEPPAAPGAGEAREAPAPAGEPPVRPDAPVPPEVAPVPRRRVPREPARDGEPTRHPRASMRESVLADLFRSTSGGASRPRQARPA
jgi:hypothetical protein